MNNSTKYTCPCCGYKTFNREDHLWDICEVCFWQSCPIQNVDAEYIGGPNPISLSVAQQNFIAFEACEKSMLENVRKPNNDEPKDENWVPIDNKKYYKRVYSETIQRFNKDWIAVDWYYFELGEDNYATKQIQVTYEGKVFKYEESNLEDENGGLAEGALAIYEEQYLAISKEEFYKLWHKKFTNAFLIKELKFDNYWQFAWFNIELNKTEQELCDGGLILCGTYKDIFLLDIEYLQPDNFLRFIVTEGASNIKYSTADDWEELVNTVQRYIDYIEKNAEFIYSKPETEKLERPAKVLVNGVLEDATFATWRNMDWDIEKFRGAELQIGEQKYQNKNTYIGVEDLLIDLQKSLPENIKMQNCFCCKYSNYNVAGNDNFGDLNCFKHCKNKCILAKTKHEIIDLFSTDYAKSQKVEETHYCEEFKPIQKDDFVYKSVVLS